MNTHNILYNSVASSKHSICKVTSIMLDVSGIHCDSCESSIYSSMKKAIKQLYRATFQGFKRGFFVADIDRIIVLIHHTTSDAMLKKVISSLTQFSNFVEVQSSLTFKGLFNP